MCESRCEDKVGVSAKTSPPLISREKTLGFPIPFAKCDAVGHRCESERERKGGTGGAYADWYGAPDPSHRYGRNRQKWQAGILLDIPAVIGMKSSLKLYIKTT